MVKVRIVNKVIEPNSREYKAALQLQKALLETCGNPVLGTIYIGYGFTLTGQTVRDIDLVVVGSLQNCRFNNLYDDPQLGKHDVVVKDFLMAVELTEQEDDLIEDANTHIIVYYPTTSPRASSPISRNTTTPAIASVNSGPSSKMIY